MLIRIVKMSFHQEHIPAFLENFELNKEKIRNSAGNRLVELYQDQNDRNIFFTYSHWDCEDDLNNYRKSILFGEVWKFTKKLFNAKPEAWSVNKIN
ncbi:MAG: antibiotic biosynthesis monooxygenase [Flavobacterium sp.]|nr:antibiotic biosynthesis monooxygenase [Flavobacterium sp.]